jgi:hypothetical protein
MPPDLLAASVILGTADLTAPSRSARLETMSSEETVDRREESAVAAGPVIMSLELARASWDTLAINASPRPFLRKLLPNLGLPAMFVVGEGKVNAKKSNEKKINKSMRV